MKKIIIFFFIIGIIFSCQKENVGFLNIEYASYSKDTLIVKIESNLELEPVINPKWLSLRERGFSESLIARLGVDKYTISPDALRVQKGAPWLSYPIEGIEGTNPIYVEYSLIETSDGDPDSFLNGSKLYGDGTIEIPFVHDIIPGTYIISLCISNESGKKYLNRAITVIVQ